MEKLYFSAPSFNRENCLLCICCVFVCQGVRVCSCWSPEVDVKYLPLLLFTVFCDRVSLTESEAHLLGNTSCQANLWNCLVPLTPKACDVHLAVQGCWDPKAGLYVDSASTLSTDPLPQTLGCVLSNTILNRGTMQSLLITEAVFSLFFGSIMEAHALYRNKLERRVSMWLTAVSRAQGCCRGPVWSKI